MFERTQSQVQDLDPDEIDDFVSIMGVTDHSGVSMAFFEHADDTTAQSVAVCGKGRNAVETWSVRPGLVELHVLQRDEVLAGLLVMVDDAWSTVRCTNIGSAPSALTIPMRPSSHRSRLYVRLADRFGSCLV